MLRGRFPADTTHARPGTGLEAESLALSIIGAAFCIRMRSAGGANDLVRNRLSVVHGRVPGARASGSGPGGPGMTDVLVDSRFLDEMELCLQVAKIKYEAALARIAELEAEVKRLERMLSDD